MLAQDRATVVVAAIGDWATASAPLHVALADALERALRVRRIAGHLPSERAFATVLHVSRGTVAAAYELLRERDVIERQRGSGSVALPLRAHTVCADPIACVREFFA